MSLFRNNRERTRTDDVTTITALNRKLAREMEKRKGAENEVKRLRQKCSELEEGLENSAGGTNDNYMEKS